MPRVKNIANQKFGKLTALYRTKDVNKHGRGVFWMCKCECGVEVALPAPSLFYGNTKSCGCLRMQLLKERHTIHGMSKTKVYAAWQKMKKRCSANAPANERKDYYDKGIRVCDDWSGKNGFLLFYNHIGDKPTSQHSLDRINNKGNYEYKNVRWATAKEQINNRNLKRIEDFSTKELLDELNKRGILHP